MKDKLYIGYICGTHGIKGELKVLSDFEKKEIAFKVNNKIMIDNIEHTITSVRYHQNKILITIDSLLNINDVLEYVKKEIYIKRENLNLDSYLMEDLIGFKIIEDEELGIVKNILITKAGYLLEIDKNFYIPFVPSYIKEVDVKNKKIIVNHAKELRLWKSIF